MSDAAQGELQKHPVFTTPFKVEPVYEMWKTPERYRDYPGGKALPDQVKVWLVQKTAKTSGGVVSFSYGFLDSPDAEVLTAGFNRGKECGAVGVGRHGNVLQWGFSAPPSQMTEAGRRFFLNCICYIRKFEGKPPLFRTRASDRLNAVRLALAMDWVKDRDFFADVFPPELLAKYEGDPKGLANYYQERLELVYREKSFRVDEDLAALGLKSNRKLESLDKLVELLNDSQRAEGARKLLARYTTQTFQSPEQWQSWLRENRQRIYFSDTAGYKFLVCPKEYLNSPAQ